MTIELLEDIIADVQKRTSVRSNLSCVYQDMPINASSVEELVVKLVSAVMKYDVDEKL
jgi:hypothetical protein